MLLIHLITYAGNHNTNIGEKKTEFSTLNFSPHSGIH